jgi:hypothetical protein
MNSRGRDPRLWPLEEGLHSFMIRFPAGARRTSALVTEWSQQFGHSDELSC